MSRLYGLSQDSSAGSPGSGRLRPWMAAALVAALTVTTAVVLTGCQSDDVSTAPAQGESSSAQRLVDTISVNGTATVTAVPDEAVITVSVETDGATPAAALDANSKQAQAVVDRLKAEGVPEEAIDTQNVTVYPLRTYNPETGEESLSGYRAQNTVTVTLTDIAQVGTILAAATEAGGTNVMGPEWRLADDSATVQQALQEAVADARQKAEVLAAAANVSVGDVLVINESGVTTPPVVYEEALRAADATAAGVPPISPKELEVVGSVNVTYRIQR